MDKLNECLGLMRRLCNLPSNEDELRKTPQWRDIASSLKRKGLKEDDILKRADLEALRLLHPENAIKYIQVTVLRR